MCLLRVQVHSILTDDPCLAATKLSITLRYGLTDWIISSSSSSTWANLMVDHERLVIRDDQITS